MQSVYAPKIQTLNNIKTASKESHPCNVLAGSLIAILISELGTGQKR